MRRIALMAALGAALAAGPALAQQSGMGGGAPLADRSAGLGGSASATSAAPRREQRRAVRASERRRQTVAARRGGNALDQGPNTPEANRAYMGGGVVLEGAPGAPAPIPQAMPRGGLGGGSSMTGSGTVGQPGMGGPGMMR